MSCSDDIRQLMIAVNQRSSKETSEDDCVFWHNAGATLLIFMDEMKQKPEKINSMTAKEYSSDNACVLVTLFRILDHLKDVNRPFDNETWHNSIKDPESSAENNNPQNMISFYELALSRCISWICQLLGDRFYYVQKLLIKNIFGNSEVCSLFASDIYVFIMRIVHPNQRMSMCQLIMNMNKLAPPEALVRGAALINRIKHPIVNFENSKYQYLLDFS